MQYLMRWFQIRLPAAPGCRHHYMATAILHRNGADAVAIMRKEVPPIAAQPQYT